MSPDPSQKREVEQTLAAMLAAQKKLQETKAVCGCGKPWLLYKEPFVVTQKFVYDTQDKCMKDLYELSCPDCGKTYEFESDSLEHFRGVADETRNIVKKTGFKERYFIRSIAKFGPKIPGTEIGAGPDPASKTG